jgi:hypothetical protein
MMPSPSPTLDGVALVLLGSFNPKIFQPMWFAAEGLVSKTEAESAEVEVIHPEVALVTIGPFTLQVVGDRFMAQTDQLPYFSPLRDLVVGVFTLLRHTPARAVGINRQMHFKANDRFSWDGLNKSLTATVAWGDALSNATQVGLDLRGTRDHAVNGAVSVRIEPSIVEEGGIFIRVNDHYELAQENSQAGLAEITDLIDSEFDSSTARALNTAQRLLEVACPPQS